jgi:hypothetical protein
MKKDWECRETFSRRCGGTLAQIMLFQHTASVGLLGDNGNVSKAQTPIEFD